MKIFALSAWKGSGKDMVADYLVQNYGFKRVSFADPLKDTVAQKFNLDRASLDDQAQKELPLKNMPVQPKDAFSQSLSSFMIGEFVFADGTKFNPTSGVRYDVNLVKREYAQLYWTRRALCILEGSSCRTADSNHWVKQAVAKMSPGGLYVIADLRYTSELDALNTAAPNTVIATRIDRFLASESSDPSERDLDNYPFPYRIDNRSASKAHVFAQVEQILTAKGVLNGSNHQIQVQDSKVNASGARSASESST